MFDIFFFYLFEVRFSLLQAAGMLQTIFVLQLQHSHNALHRLQSGGQLLVLLLRQVLGLQ